MRDLLVIGIVAFALGSIIFGVWYKFPKSLGSTAEEGVNDQQAQNYGLSEKQIQQEIRSVQDMTDTSSWKNYQSKWYGVEVQYPGDWLAPKHQTGKKDTKWAYLSQFRKDSFSADDPYVGFDIVIYDLSSVKELYNTDEFPKLKNGKARDRGECQTINGHIYETGDYPAEEIYIPDADDCYDRDLFFSFTRGNYIYNLVPITGERYAKLSDPMIDIMDHFPEFFSVVSKFKITDIVRPKAELSTLKVKKSPMPVSYARENGRLVCAKKNDHPSKSKENKKGHTDMECCLDPDETPNSNCYYPPEKYGKYL